MRVWGIPIAIASAGLLGGSAFAQIPPSASPGRVEERFKPPVVPQAKPEEPLPQPEPVTPSAAELAAQFTLNSVSVDGSTVFSSADFEPLYRPLLGKPVTLLDMYRVRDAITAQYRSAGYTLSQAIIPPQRIEDGTVHIQIVEGYIGKVSFEGDVQDARGLLEATARKIEESKPLRQQDLERYTLLLSDLPGVEVNTVLKPSADTPAAADLVIILKRHSLAGFMALDNRGSRAIGPLEASAGIDLNNILGLNEQTSLLLASAIPTRELRYVAVRHTEILNAEGWRLALSASDSLSKPGGAISALSARGTGTIVSAFLTAPVIRSRARSLKLEAGFTYQNTRTDLLSTLFSRDRVRFGTLRASYDFSDSALGRSASTLIQAEIDHGFDVFGATKTGSANLSRANGDSTYTLVAGEMTRVQGIAPQFSVLLSATGQYSFDSLLSSQQFGLGGKRFGRGYEPSELTGDNGVGFSFELRQALPYPQFGLDAQAYAFYDVGKVWTKTPLVGQPSNESLSSAGVGVRLKFQHFSAEFELAKPLTRDIASRGNRNVRPLFSLSASF